MSILASHVLSTSALFSISTGVAVDEEANVDKANETGRMTRKPITKHNCGGIKMKPGYQHYPPSHVCCKMLEHYAMNLQSILYVYLTRGLRVRTVKVSP